MNGRKLRITNDNKTVGGRLPTLRHKNKKQARGVMETITITRETAVFPSKPKPYIYPAQDSMPKS